MNISNKILFIGIPGFIILIVGLTFLINPMMFWHWNSPYKTQEIIYRNKEDKDCTIEFQMQDSGAFGYNRRIVKVSHGIFFNSASPVDTATIDKSKWDKVDQYVNEMGMKGG